jgi:RND family efflux transporter MFP subunit
MAGINLSIVGEQNRVKISKINKLVLLMLLGLLLGAGGCGRKAKNGSSDANSPKKDGQVQDATGEAQVASASGEASIAAASGEAKVGDATAAGDIANGTEAIGKKEFVFRVPVTTMKVRRGEMKAYLSSTGTLSPEEQMLVRAEIGGRITFTRNWNEGDAVQAGQLIATIDNEEVRYLKEEATKNLQLAEERLPSSRERKNLAERNLASKERLYQEGVISRLDYDQADLQRMDAEITYKQAVAEVETRKTELEKVKYKQDRALIEAPFNGVLVRKEYLEPKQGQVSYPIMSLDGRVVGGGESLFGIIKTSRFILDVDVSSKEIQKVEPGQAAEVHVYGGEVISVTGEVTKISTALDPVSRAFKVTVGIENLDNLPLRAGMFCKVDIVVERRLDSIALPKEIVQTRNNRKVVFVVSGEAPEFEAEEREVNLGISNRHDVEITSGLKEGDLLIVRGYETLKGKTKVKLVQADEDQTEEPEEDVSGRQTGS